MKHEDYLKYFQKKFDDELESRAISLCIDKFGKPRTIRLRKLKNRGVKP